MKCSILAFSKQGYSLANRIKNINISEIFYKEINGPIKEKMGDIWIDSDLIIFIGATGIAVRYIASFIQGKDLDPAVLVIDDYGKFVISLLSGHLGGANNFAQIYAKELGAQAVITTASDNRNIQGIDLFAKENNYFIEDLNSVTPVISLMVNGEKIGFYSETDKIINYPNLEIVKDLNNIQDDIKGLLIVSSSTEEINFLKPYTILRPKNINIGIGSKKDTSSEDLINLLIDSFKRYKISINSIKSIGTINIKKNEKSILELAKFLNLELKIFTAKELEEFEDFYEGSEFVKKTVGVSSVSATVAHKLGGNVFAEKISDKGFTLSLSKEE